ncbi:hypothetical protein [Streptomyces triculaminicus]|uniref:hypothetical protein n=1 Tax=Streptomyces triculaminicus TaxID=2816232 RepID=UPI0037D1849B
MRHEDVPEPQERGLSTDDLARASGGDAEGPSGVPAYPGESTEVTGPGGVGAEDTGAEDTGTEGTDTEGTDTEGESAATGGVTDEEEAPRLLNTDDEEGFRTRWQDIQNTFVDDPRDAVHSADQLVAEVMQMLATTFSRTKEDLEGQWNRGEEADTEALRQALRHYRSFFNRLLTA